MLEKLISQLKSPDAATRFNAVTAIARMPAHDDWRLGYDAVEALLTGGEQDGHIRSAAAITLSMMAARNIPSHFLYGSPIPDFLPDSYAKARVGLSNQPSPQDFDRLNDRFGQTDDPTS